MKIYIKTSIIIVSFMILLSSCGKINKEGTTSEVKNIVNPSEVKFLGQWWGEGKREQLVRDICREYEFTHQEVKVVLKFPEEVYYKREDYFSNQRFVANIMKDEKPEWDIIRINNDYEGITDFMKETDWPKKYLVDFSEYEEFKKNTLPELQTNEMKARWHGIIPGPYIEGFNFALWFNKDVAKKVGIEVKQFDMTFNDFLGYIKKVNEYNEAHPSDYIVPFYEAPNWPTFFAVPLQLYASALDDTSDFFRNKPSEAKYEAWFKTLQALEQLAAYKPFSPNLKNMEWWASRNIMVEGKCLFYSNGSWMYNIWLQGDQSKIYNCVPAEYPSFKTPKTYIGGYQVIWAVLKNAPHKEEAVKFLLSWNSHDVADRWTQYTKSPTGIKGTFSTSDFGLDQFEKYIQHIHKRYGNHKIPFLCDSRYILGERLKTVPNYYLDVAMGNMTAKEAFAKMRAQVR